MARAENDSTVTQSVLDRLIDAEPRVPADPYITRAQSVRQLKASLRRDLEWLLNTRRSPEGAGETEHELARSLYNYGLPDFSAYSINSPKDRNRLLRAIESTIAYFEPRLASVKVTPIEVAGVNTRVLRFQIEGMLLMDPAPEQVSFDTVLQLTSGEYQVKGDRSAG
jgi:type VI secretion system protein ImpF